MEIIKKIKKTLKGLYLFARQKIAIFRKFRFEEAFYLIINTSFWNLSNKGVWRYERFFSLKLSQMQQPIKYYYYR